MKHTNQHNKSSASIRVYLRQKTQIGMTMASASGALYAAFMAFRRKEEEELSSDDFGLSNEEDDSSVDDLVNHETHENHEREGEVDVDNVDDVGLEDDFVDGLEGSEELSNVDFGLVNEDGKTQGDDGGVPSSSEPTNFGSGVPEVSERGIGKLPSIPYKEGGTLQHFYEKYIQNKYYLVDNDGKRFYYDKFVKDLQKNNPGIEDIHNIPKDTKIKIPYKKKVPDNKKDASKTSAKEFLSKDDVIKKYFPDGKISYTTDNNKKTIDDLLHDKSLSPNDRANIIDEFEVEKIVRGDIFSEIKNLLEENDNEIANIQESLKSKGLKNYTKDDFARAFKSMIMKESSFNASIENCNVQEIDNNGKLIVELENKGTYRVQHGRNLIDEKDFKNKYGNLGFKERTELKRIQNTTYPTKTNDVGLCQINLENNIRDKNIDYYKFIFDWKYNLEIGFKRLLDATQAAANSYNEWKIYEKTVKKTIALTNENLAFAAYAGYNGGFSNKKMFNRPWQKPIIGTDDKYKDCYNKNGWKQWEKK